MHNAHAQREKLNYEDAAIPFSYDIRFDDCTPSDAVRYAVEEQLSRLTHFFDRITDCRVSVRIPHKHSGKRTFHINIQLDVPGKRIAVNREPDIRDDHTKIHLAVHDAFHKLTRQLEDYVNCRRIRKSRKERPKMRELEIEIDG